MGSAASRPWCARRNRSGYTMLPSSKRPHPFSPHSPPLPYPHPPSTFLSTPLARISTSPPLPYPISLPYLHVHHTSPPPAYLPLLPITISPSSAMLYFPPYSPTVVRSAVFSTATIVTVSFFREQFFLGVFQPAVFPPYCFAFTLIVSWCCHLPRLFCRVLHPSPMFPHHFSQRPLLNSVAPFLSARESSWVGAPFSQVVLNLLKTHLTLLGLPSPFYSFNFKQYFSDGSR